MKSASGYAHTQNGVLLPILLALAVICLLIAFFLRAIPPYTIILMAAAFVCAVLAFAHGRLTVRDEDDHLSVRFGPIPLFKKSIPYAEIPAVGKCRSHFISGWGIHLTSKGWLWNIGGFDCVRIEMGTKSMLIGTDDSDGLVVFLRSKASGDILHERKPSS